jgi:hypothetical protein
MLKNSFAKKIEKKFVFLIKITAICAKTMIITLVLKKIADFFTENWQTSAKIPVPMALS